MHFKRKSYKMVNFARIIHRFSIAVILCSTMQLFVCVIAAVVCELIGIQAKNAVCNLYFDAQTAKDVVSLGNMSTRRWCLIWRDGNGKGNGIQCVRADRLLSWIGHSDTPDTVEKEGGEITKTSKRGDSKYIKPDPTVPLPSTNVFNSLMPQIKLKGDVFKPKRWISRKRKPVSLVIGLATYKASPTANRLYTTLDSLVLAISSAHQHNCLILVFITEIFDDKYVEALMFNLVKRYSVQIDIGLMEIILPRETFYASLYPTENASVNLNYSKHVRPRKKQCMDQVYMMALSYLRGKYYLQLSDAVLTRPNLFTWIQKALDKHVSVDWVMMRLSPSSVVGRLFRSSDLPDLISYIARINMDKPVSFHLENFLIDKQLLDKHGSYNKSRLVPLIVPNLFRFASRHDPKDGQLKSAGASGGVHKNHKARLLNFFPRLSVLHSRAVPSYVPCSTIRFTNDIIPLIIPGVWPYKLNGVMPGGRADIKFTPPLSIFKIKLVTGLAKNKSSTLGEDTTVWVHSPNLQKFKMLGSLTSDGDLEMNLPSDLQSVQVLEILFGKIARNKKDIFLSELTITMSCRRSTRTHLFSTVTIKPATLPPWYVSAPPVLPRREQRVLISY